MSLRIATEYYTHRYASAEVYLKMLDRKHALRGIPRDLYPDFRDCLLDTFEQFFGEAWTPELQSEWISALNLASDAMVLGYDAAE